jgi:hypothetical protein
METTAIFALIEKGLTLLPILIEAGENVANLIAKMQVLTKDAQNGSVTDEQLAELEAELDALIASFNDPISEE